MRPDLPSGRLLTVTTSGIRRSGPFSALAK